MSNGALNESAVKKEIPDVESSQGEDFANASDDNSTEEPIQFRWSKRRHRIRVLVREFSEQTTADY